MAGLLDSLSVDQQLELIYIGYFDRAADGAGFNFWVTQNANAQAGGQSKEVALTNIANSFTPQPETLAKYPLLGTTPLNFSSPAVQAQVGDLVNDIYLNLFNHAADAAGKAYWVNQIVTGAFPIGKAILAIANGATGDDATILTNKITVALDFTIDTSVAGLGFPANDAFLSAAAAVLDGVGTGAGSVTNAMQFTDQFIANGGGINNQIALTTGLDNVIGTAAGDAISGSFFGAPTDTYQFGDQVDGGSGVDSLTIQGSDPGGTSVKNVELVTFNNPTGAVFLDASSGNYAGITTANVRSAGTTILTKSNATTATVDGVAGGFFSITDLGAAGTDKLATVSVTNTVGGAIASDALTSLSDTNNTGGSVAVTAAAGTRTVNVAISNNADGSGIIDAEATTLEVTSSGTASKYDLVAAKAATVNIKGDAALTADGGTDFAAAAVITVTNTAGVTLVNALESGQTFTGGSGKDSVVTGGVGTKAVAMGGGNDSVAGVIAVSGAAVGTGGSIGGGDGTDKFLASAASFANVKDATTGAKFAGGVTGFETAMINAGSAGAAIDLGFLNTSAANTFSTVELGVDNTGALTINNFASGNTLQIDTTQTGPTTLFNSAFAGSTTDVANVNLTGKAAISAGTITALSVETVAFTSDDANTTVTGAVVHSATLDDPAAKAITVKGDTGFIVGTNSTALTSLDASGLTTASATVTGLSASLTGVLTGAATITGTGGIDTIAAATQTKVMTVNTGAGADVITTGSGADVIDAGAGDDVILAGSGLNQITTGAGKDTVTLTAATSGNAYSTITDATTGDTIDFAAAVTAITKVGALAPTAVFQDYLDAATAAAADGKANWFQFNGDTYVVQNNAAEATFKNGTDDVVKLTGVVDLSTATVVGGNVVLG